MSTIFRRGKIFYIQYMFSGKRFHKSLATKNKTRALYIQKEVDKYLDIGSLPDFNEIFKDKRKTIGNLLEYIEKVRQDNEGNLSISPNHRKRVDVILRHFKRFLEHKKIQYFFQVDYQTPIDYRNFRFKEPGKGKGKHLSPKTLKDELSLIKNMIFRRAMRERIIRENPFEFATENLRVYRNQRQPFTKEEVEKILQNAPNRLHRDFYATLYFTGARFGEIAHLTWDEVDLDNRIIYIRDKAEHRTKTRQSRKITIHPRLHQILLERKKSTKGKLVFPSPHWGKEEKPIRTLQRHFKELKEKLGIDQEKTLHSFRHSFATHLKESGVPIEVIRDMLGHADIRMTTRYQITSMSQIKKAINKLTLDF